MGEETPPVQKSAKQLEKEAKKAAEKAAKLEKLAAKQAKQVSENKILCIIYFCGHFELKHVKLHNSLSNPLITSRDIDLLCHDGECGLGGDPAHVCPGPRHPHVAALAPVCAPAVLQDVEFLSAVLIHPIAHGQHPVVKGTCAAVLMPVDSSAVMIKTPMACVYSNCDRALKE